MSLSQYVRGMVSRPVRELALWRLARQEPFSDLTREHWPRSLEDPRAFYLDCVRYFFRKLPAQWRAHRAYFYNVPGNRRGFGEDAFHVMWFLLLREFAPANFLEIGVFRGQVASLVALWARLNQRSCEVCGISPFTPAGDSVSSYYASIDYWQDTLDNFAHFSLPPPRLIRALSTDDAAVQIIRSGSWDLIYLDGNHDYEVARQDWNVSSRAIRPGGIIVLDDAGLSTRYAPPCFSSRGHPGPSRLAEEIDRKNFREILQVGHNRAFQRSA